MHRGACMCGAVSFEVIGALPTPDACHCTECRKQSGHFWVSTDVARTSLTIHGDENLGWYSSSEKVRRGFCRICGSSLFWDPVKKDTIGVAMGAFDLPTDTTLGLHIFVAEKGDYYEIMDGLPQNQH
ncbi:MAG: GFA family protein [Gammaproteobacteria bacterium]|nr:GFA family protein [Gammaproteobacteria bacterium]